MCSVNHHSTSSPSTCLNHISLTFSLEDRRDDGSTACQPKITAQVIIGEKSDKVTYKVAGLIYWDKSHFTCRMLAKTGEVYYNDGMTTGTTCLHEGKLNEIQDLYNTKNAQLTYIILSLV